MSAVADYDLYGLIRIRLVDPPPGILGRLRRELGPLRASKDGPDPDLSIRFVDALPISNDLRYLGLHQAAYDAGTFYLLDSQGRRAAVAIDQLGEPCEVVCEREMAHIPLLRDAVSLRLLAKGHVMLHSSAFIAEGKTVLVTGWQKGGKTELLLGFMSDGARFVSDEWTVLRKDTRALLGATGGLDVWDWHFRQLPDYWRKIRPSERIRLRLLGLYRAWYRLVRPPRVSGFGLDLLHRLSEEGAVAAAGQVRTTPTRLFDGPPSRDAQLDLILLAAVATGPSRARRLDPAEVASRMVGSQTYERKRLYDAYAAFRYAFPTRGNPILDSAPDRELELLTAFMGDIPAYEVVHPYPVSLGELRDLVRPLLAGLPGTGAEAIGRSSSDDSVGLTT